MSECRHDKVRKYVLEELEWDGEECCVGHGFESGPCWVCPECSKYVSYEDRKLMEIYEKLAAIEHERWADWQVWCHKILRENCGSPELEKVLERWDIQIATPYGQLSESEKKSDREQVDRYWQLLLDNGLRIME
ncbi:MAG: hypothetical protein ACXABY_29225 [Candidatus Thorarchaeota archaeon]